MTLNSSANQIYTVYMIMQTFSMYTYIEIVM